MDAYHDDFISGDEATRKLAVKRLTRKIDLESRMMTVNSPDWWVPLLQNPTNVSKGYCVCCKDGERDFVDI